MPIEILPQNLVNDQSSDNPDTDILQDSDILVSTLQSSASAYYNLLNGVGLFGAAGDDSFAEDVGAAVSVNDWIFVNESGDVDSIYFSKDNTGAALDGSRWEVGLLDDPVLTLDGQEIFLYSILGGTVMIASTEDTGELGVADLSTLTIGDFDPGQIVLSAFLDYDAATKTAEVYTVTFEGLDHPLPADPDDTLSLEDNLWVSAAVSEDFFFDQLESTKFLFGIVGSEDTTQASTKLFVVADGYNVNSGETRVNGNLAGAALNTSQAGQLDAFPGLKVATIGVDNQTINELQAVYMMATMTDAAPGSYQDGDDIDAAWDAGDVQMYTSFGITITQAVSNTAVSIKVSGFQTALSGADAIQNTGSPTDITFGHPTHTKSNIVKVTIIDGALDPVEVQYSTYTSPADPNPVDDVNGRSIQITFNGDNTEATVTGLEAQDTILVEYAQDTAYFKFLTLTGKIDIGKASTEEGDLIHANVGAQMFYDDDAPLIDIDTVDGASISIELDESIVLPNTTADEDDLVAAGADDPGAGDTFIGQTSTPAAGAGSIASLFTDVAANTDAGTDGQKSRTDTYKLVLIDDDGNPVTDTTTGVISTLSVSTPVAAGGDATIVFYRVSDTQIEGRAALDADGVHDDVALTYSLAGDPPVLTTTQDLPISHGTDTDHDEAATLGFDDPDAKLTIVKTSTLVDNDDDEATDSASYDMTDDTVIEDDGPLIDIDTVDGASISIELDESIVLPNTTADEDDLVAAGADDPGAGDTFIGQTSTPAAGAGSIASLFTDVAANTDAGTDGQKSRTDTYKLVLIDDDGNPVTDTTTGVISTLSVSTPVAAGGDATIVFYRVSDTQIEGRAALDADGVHDDVALTYSLAGDPPVLTTTQDLPISHGTDTDHDEAATLGFDDPDAKLTIVKTSTLVDNDDDEATDSASYDMTDDTVIEDDGPLIDIDTVDGASISIELDESIVLPNTTADEDDLVAAGADDPGAGDTFIGQTSTPAAGAGSIASLFTDVAANTDAGTDGQKSRTDTYKLVLIDDDGNPVTDTTTGVISTLSVSTPVAAGGDATIVFYRVSDTQIEGRAALDADGVHDDVALTYSLAGDPPVLTTTQDLPISHGTDTDHDEAATLGFDDPDAKLTIVKTSTLVDNDDDEATDSASYDMTDDTVIEDDGPLADVNADASAEEIDAIRKNLDESIGNPDPRTANDVGAADHNSATDDVATSPTYSINPLAAQAIGRLSTVANQLSDLFDLPTATNDYGTDGPGDAGSGSGQKDSLKLELSAPVVATNMVATAVTGEAIALLDADARKIFLVQVSDTVVEGRTQGDVDGITPTDPANPADYDSDEYVIFRITLNNPDTPTLATLDYDQFGPVVHPFTDQYDEELKLLLTGSETLDITYTTKRVDADDDSAEDEASVTLIDAGDSVVSVDDDGPVVNTPDPIRVEEDDISASATPASTLSEGLNEDASTNAHTVATNLGLLISDAGIEADLEFSIKTGSKAALETANSTLTSQGGAVRFDVTGNVITGFVDEGVGDSDGVKDGDDRVVFTYTLVGNVGTLVLFDQIDHPADLVERDETDADDDNNGATGSTDQENERIINLSAGIQAAEQDGDIWEPPASFLQYSVQDDIPDIGDNGANNVAAIDADLIPGAVIDFETNSTTPAGGISLQARIGTDENPDGGGVTITDYDVTKNFLDDLGNIVLTVTGTLSGDFKTVTYYDAENVKHFELHIDDTDADSSSWNYTWTAFEEPPATESPLNFNAIKAGGPKEILSVPTVGGGTYVHFDSLFISSGWNVDSAVLNTQLADGFSPMVMLAENDGTGVNDIPGSNTQFGNPDALGFGHSSGQASQFNHNEGFWAIATSSSDLIAGATKDMFSLSFSLQFIGNTKKVFIEYVTVNDGVISSVTQYNDGNGVVPFTGREKNDPVPVKLTAADGGEFDAIFVRTSYEGNVANKGVRLLEFMVGEPAPTQDALFNWEATITDFEGDIDVATFKTGVDGTLQFDDDMVTGVDEGNI